jgi:hypothetical protein
MQCDVYFTAKQQEGVDLRLRENRWLDLIGLASRN